jgi:hypothetical protein
LNQPDHAGSIEREDPLIAGQVNARGNLESRVRRLVEAFLRDLVAFRPEGRRTNLAAALTYATELLKHRSIVVVLSDFLAEGWEQPLRQLGVRHDVVAVAIEDRRETELPDAGWLDLEDAETGSRRLVDTSDRQVRGRLRALAERLQGQRDIRSVTPVVLAPSLFDRRRHRLLSITASHNAGRRRVAESVDVVLDRHGRR